MKDYKIGLTRCETTLTAVVRDHVPAGQLSKFVPTACGEVWSFIRATGLPKPGRHIALYLDGDGSVEVGAEVSGPFIGNERIHCSRLPPGRVATTTHFGPYNGLGSAHAAIHGWCTEHNEKMTGVSWEVYGHWEDAWNADPSQIRTDVFHLLHEIQI